MWIYAVADINILARVRGMGPSRQVRRVTVNIRHACVQTNILGVARLVLSVLVNIRKSVTGVMRPAELIPAVAVIMQNAVVPLGMNGKMVVARNKSSTVPKANCITATARWLVFVLQVWASMLR